MITKDLDELRYWVIEQLVSLPLQSKLGTHFAYANMGYMLAGATAAADRASAANRQA